MTRLSEASHDWSRVLPIGALRHLPALGGRTTFLPYSKNSDTYTAKGVSSAFKLIKVENVQVLLLAHWGTFASMPNLSVTEQDFRISLMKYLAPMLYDADKSQL